MIVKIVRNFFSKDQLIRGSSGAFCLDIRTAVDFVLPKGCQFKVPTGIYSSFPKEVGVFFRERSGLADKGIRLGGGTIDSDYRGEWKVLLRYEPCVDIGERGRAIMDAFSFKAGDRICQAVFLPSTSEEIVFIDQDELEESKRGAGGFGSTGI
jgi:dUTP pyrophosphatase